jgi:Ni/Fe-hydrogenase subunit HybB-like protein
MNRYRHKQTIVFLQINQHFWKHVTNIIYILLKINVLIPTIVLRLKEEQRRKTVFTFWGYYQEPNCTMFPWPTIWKIYMAAMTKNTNFIQNVMWITFGRSEYILLPV